MASPFNQRGPSAAPEDAPVAPPDHDEEPKGKKACLYCKKDFDTRAELAVHKKEKLMEEFATGGPKKVLHNFCYICNKDFIARDAVEAHWTQFHAKRQNIDCPGCKAHFPLFSGFVKHVELNLCPKLSQQTVAARAEASLNFTRQLSALDPDAAIRHKDFAPFLDGSIQTLQRASYSTAPKDAWTQPVAADDWNADPKLAPKPGDFPRQEYRNYLHGNSQVPDYLTGDEISCPTEEKTNPWASGKQLFPNAAPSQQPSSNQLQKLEWLQADQKAQMEQARTATMDPDNPNSRGWDAKRYFNPYLRKYKCPRNGCTKSFKNAEALKSHLKSLAHTSDKKVTCPSCLSTFQSLHSLASHVESASKKCGIRHSDFFSIFIGQLTWNLIEVTGKHGEDGTTKYDIAKTAKEDYGVVKPSQPKPTFGHQQIHGSQPVTTVALAEQQKQIRQQDQQSQVSAVPGTLLTEAALAQQQRQNEEQWNQSLVTSAPRTTHLTADTLTSFENQRARDFALSTGNDEKRGFEEEGGWGRNTMAWGEPAIGWGEEDNGWTQHVNVRAQQDSGIAQQDHSWDQQSDLWTQENNDWDQEGNRLGHPPSWPSASGNANRDYRW